MSLKSILEDLLPEEKLNLVPKGFEVIGDIALINIPQSLDADKHIIAKALVSHRKDVRCVLRKISKVRGEERVGDFELILGDRTKTIHRENNCVFHVDVAGTYFSGKLAYERDRVVHEVVDGEYVLVMFCGVGPFLVPIKKNRDINITGLDMNPVACSLLRKNLVVNGIEAEIVLADGGAPPFRKLFDRIVMPTPYGQDHFLNHAGNLLKPGGVVHFYTFKKDFEIDHFKRLLEERGWEIEFFRGCGNVAPRVKRYVFDLKKPRSI